MWQLMGRWGDWQDLVEEKHGINRTTQWRKGSQWNALIRSHAQLAVDDTKLVKLFSEDCHYCFVRSQTNPLLTALLYPPEPVESL